MNHQIKDLTGQTFNDLTVVSYSHSCKPTPNYKKNQIFWNCQCKCGEFRVVDKNSLKKGHTKSCSFCAEQKMKDNRNWDLESRIALSEENGIDHRGEKINNWKVSEEYRYKITPSNKLKKLYKCQCACGAIKEISSFQLMNSVPDCYECRDYKNLVGEVINHLEVISYVGLKKQSRYWKCRCECGNTVDLVEHNILEKIVNHCGSKCGLEFKYYEEDLRGQRFGRLKVVDYIMTFEKKRLWVADCDCGNQHITKSKYLKGESCKSCGCLQEEMKTRNGMSKSREYWAWKYINYYNRYLNPVEIHDKWINENGFFNFLDDIGKCPSKFHYLMRINPQQGFVPGNVKWGYQEEKVLNYKHGLSKLRLYSTFKENQRRGTFDGSIWKDFMDFYLNMGDRPEGARLARKNMKRPHGPDNSYWKIS